MPVYLTLPLSLFAGEGSGASGPDAAVHCPLQSRTLHPIPRNHHTSSEHQTPHQIPHGGWRDQWLWGHMIVMSLCHQYCEMCHQVRIQWDHKSSVCTTIKCVGKCLPVYTLAWKCMQGQINCPVCAINSTMSTDVWTQFFNVIFKLSWKSIYSSVLVLKSS